MMATGQYAAAAEIFEQFARGAVQRNGPRAPLFLLQAGRARLHANQVPAAMAHFLEGFAIIAKRGNDDAVDDAAAGILQPHRFAGA